MEFYGRLGNFSVNSSDKIGLLAPIHFLRSLNDLIRGTDSR